MLPTLLEVVEHRDTYYQLCSDVSSNSFTLLIIFLSVDSNKHSLDIQVPILRQHEVKASNWIQWYAISKC